MLSIFKNIIGFILVAGLVYFLIDNWDMFKATQEVSLTHLSILGLCVLATWVVNSTQMFCILRAMNVKVGAFENLIVQTMTILANYLPMRMGSIIRFQYFKKVYGIEYSRFAGVVSVRAIFLMFSSGLLGMVALLIWYDLEGLHQWGIFVLFVLMFVFPLIVYLLKPSVSFKNKHIVRLLSLFSHAFKTMSNNHKLSIVVVSLLILQYAILAIRLYVSFDAMGQTLPLYAFLILAPIATLLSFITITPGNIGLREWVIGAISVVLGYGFDVAMFAGMVDRVVLVICTFVFGSVSSVYVWKKLSSS